MGTKPAPTEELTPNGVAPRTTESAGAEAAAPRTTEMLDAAKGPRGATQGRSEDSSKLREEEGTRQARVHLVVGPVGAGKSTFALQLAHHHGAVRLTLDAWMARLFRPDRPDDGVMAWYVERVGRCVEQIWSIAEEVVSVGVDVVLELGLIQREERLRFYERVEAARVALTIYVLEAERDVRRRRVEARNRERGATFSMVVPPPIFELASDLWEPPEPRECQGRDVRFHDTSGDERP